MTAWLFAQEVYARQGVAGALLHLQDREGVDVPLLLVLLYAADRGIALDRQDIEALPRSTEKWRTEIVEPLRRARRALKDDPRDRAGDLHRQVKLAELWAEETVIEELGRRLPDGGGDAADRGLAIDNLAAYAALLGIEPERFTPLLDRLHGRAG